jgi:hypothetical protein
MNALAAWRHIPTELLPQGSLPHRVLMTIEIVAKIAAIVKLDCNFSSGDSFLMTRSTISSSGLLEVSIKNQNEKL